MYDKKMMALVGRLVKAGLPVLIPNPSQHEAINDGVKRFYKRAIIELRNGHTDFVCWAFDRSTRSATINITPFRAKFAGITVFTYIALNVELRKVIVGSSFNSIELVCHRNRAFRVAWVKTMLNMFNKKVRESKNGR